METQTIRRLKQEAEIKRPRTLRRILIFLFIVAAFIVTAMVIATRKSGPNDYNRKRDVSTSTYTEPHQKS